MDLDMQTEIISKFIREQRRYSKTELANIFEYDGVGINRFISVLKSYGVLKAVKNTPEQKMLSDLLDDDIQIEDDVADGAKYLYVFTYVGVIIFGNRVMKIYPKYLPDNVEPLDKMKQVLKVLTKYNKSKKQTVNLYNGAGAEKSFNYLAVILFILNDYLENGVYEENEEVTEINGEGEILWGKTIDEGLAIIKDNVPYYMDMITQRSSNDEANYFTRLHLSVVTECSKQLHDSQLETLFGIEKIYASDEEIESFGDTYEILGKISSELSEQFNTRKQVLLKTLYAYISQKAKLLYSGAGISMFGTNSFNLVWETACGSAFNNLREVPLKNLHLPSALDTRYSPKDNLLKIIDKPAWHGDRFVKEADRTFIPDIVTFTKRTFIILDAKYYVLHLEKGENISGQPGVEDVGKQYIYQIAYKDFLHAHKFCAIKNAFILPTDKDFVVLKGYAELNMFSKMDLEKILIRLVPACQVYDSYLMEDPMDLDILKLDQIY